MKVACVQLNVGVDPAENLHETLGLVDQAIDLGTKLIALPECANLLRPESSGLVPERVDRTLLGAALSARARQAGVQMLIGSVLGAIEGQEKLANRQLLIGIDGALTAAYDKIHLFDVEVGDGQSYRESSRYQAGARVVTSDMGDGWTLGHSICYDVRFPELYRALVGQGANLIAVPAAFTHVTGTAHWHSLLRARAIESASYVIAPAQCGYHWGAEDRSGRRTYGHSLIIDPWGEIVTEASEDHAEIIVADLDLTRVTEVRAKVPSLHNRRADLFG